MACQFLANIINSLRGNLYNAIDRKRLHAVYEHTCKPDIACQHKLCPKRDFIIKTREAAPEDDNYNQLLEHHGLEFWNRYYEGEHPECILTHSLIEHQPYRIYEDRKNIKAHLLQPDQLKQVPQEHHFWTDHDR
jgi:hypothetical protein